LSAAVWETLRGFDADSNFEVLFHALETMYSINTTGPQSTTRAIASAFASLNPRWNGLKSEKIVDLYESCLKAVHASLADAADEVERARTPQYELTAKLLARLKERFFLRVFDLNYDDVGERMAEPIRDGFDTHTESRFDYADLCIADERTEWCHLHGSIRYEMVCPGTHRRGGDPHIVKHPSRGAAASTFWQNVRIVGQDNEVAFMGPIISSLRKSSKARFDPFAIYHHRFVSALLECPRLMVIGYGGSDTHISDWLYQWRRVHRDRARLVWVTWRRDGREPHKDLHFPRYAAGNGQYAGLPSFTDDDFSKGEFQTSNAYVLFTGSPPTPDVADRALAFLAS
jgi:hypothetical protein